MRVAVSLYINFFYVGYLKFLPDLSKRMGCFQLAKAVHWFCHGPDKAISASILTNM